MNDDVVAEELEVTVRPKSIRFSENYYDVIRHMGKEQRHVFYDAMFDYAFDDVVPDFGGDVLLEVAWSGIKHELDKSIARSLSGQMGGRPRKEVGSDDQSAKVKGNELRIPVRFVL